MCGICGIIKNDGINENDKSALCAMLEVLQRRGPDGEGIFQTKEALLGSRRLAIVDVEKGHQPLTIGNLTVVFNGEIYNHEELRAELETKDIVFQTRSDTETLLRAYEVFGADCLLKLDGQFAFAIWDRWKKELFVARDRFGEKPLYYKETNENELIFASVPTAIVEHPKIEAGVDQYSLGFFILQSFTFAAGDAPLNHSFFNGINELPPGHFLVHSNGKITMRKWYKFSTEEDSSVGFLEAAQKVRATLEESVKKRVAGEVRNGVALSGGLDSSIIAALAKNHDSAMVTSCISFQGDQNEDLVHARIVAEDNSIRLIETDTSVSQLRKIIDQMVDAMGSPHCMIRQIVMLENYRRLHEAGAKVALAGEGADELFFGYWHKFPGFKLDKEAITRNCGFVEICSSRVGNARGIFTDEFNSQMDYEKAVAELASPFETFDSDDSFRKTQKFYLDHFLSSFLLRANDRLGMYNSVEPRLPFLSNRVVELAASLPIDFNANEQTEKMALREAFRRILPPQIYKRRKAPLPAALHSSFHREIVSFLKDSIESADKSVWEILDKEKIRRLCGEYEIRLSAQGNGQDLVGFRPLNQEFSVGTIHIFSVLSVLRWHQRFIAKINDGEFQSPPHSFTRRNDGPYNRNRSPACNPQ